MTQNNSKLINHIFMLVDASGSMGKYYGGPGEENVKKIFKSQIEEIKEISIKMGQETRASLYTFAGGGTWNRNPITLKVEAFDVDVMRLPSLDTYKADGGTPMLDCINLALEDKKLISEKYGDHAFIFYVLSDGEENTSKATTAATLKIRLQQESRLDNVTIIGLAPDEEARRKMICYGFDGENVRIWDVSEKGLEKEKEVFTSATQNFFQARTMGVKKSANYFNLDETKLTSKEVKKNFKPLDPKTYTVYNVNYDSRMDEFQTAFVGAYQSGAGYYQLTKKEFIQPQKYVLIRERKTGKVYDAANSRQILGLPNTTIKVNPIDNSEYDVFVQSTANNRKLLKGTQCLILK